MFDIESKIEELSKKAVKHCDLQGGMDVRSVVRFVVEAIAVDSLSARESQILRLLGRGYTTREIADQLRVSIKTVDAFREILKRKLNLKNANQLIVKAARLAGN